MAHPHTRPRHQEIEGGSVRIRIGKNEGGDGPGVAGGDSFRGSEPETDQRSDRLRDGPVQVQKRVHNVLCVCC